MKEKTACDDLYVVPATKSRHHKPVSAVDRFWRYVNKTDSCWLWTGTKSVLGYGRFYVMRDRPFMHQAHRISWRIHRGEIPHDLCVLHRCDNPPCVNPDHLFVGTHRDNSDDRNAKGRRVIVSGEQCGTHKLTEKQVKEIRKEYEKSGSYKQLSKKYNVYETTIYRIVIREAWKHI